MLQRHPESDIVYVYTNVYIISRMVEKPHHLPIGDVTFDSVCRDVCNTSLMVNHLFHFI